jgi:hypothetical protein
MLTKNVLGYILGEFFSQTHLVTLAVMQYDAKLLPVVLFK